MDNQNKSRLAEVLGVEETEEIRIVGGEYETDWFCIDQANGTRDLPCGAIVWAINHQKSIIRAPRLTEPEIAIMRAVGAKWVSLSENVNNERVVLWRNRPEKTKKGTYLGANSIAYVNIDRFPSVKPGDCVCLGERDDG